MIKWYVVILLILLFLFIIYFIHVFYLSFGVLQTSLINDDLNSNTNSNSNPELCWTRIRSVGLICNYGVMAEPLSWMVWSIFDRFQYRPSI